MSASSKKRKTASSSSSSSSPTLSSHPPHPRDATEDEKHSPSPLPTLSPSFGDTFQVKILNRPAHLFDRASSSSYHQLHRNYDPLLHPFAKAREYTRALNAVKLDKLFAAPFEFALSDHRDGIYTISTLPKHITEVASASADGFIYLWDLNAKRHLWAVKGHNGMVKGIQGDRGGGVIYSCGQDATVKAWRRDPFYVEDTDGDDGEEKRPHRDVPSTRIDKILLRQSHGGAKHEDTLSPHSTYLGTNGFTSIDCHYGDSNLFSTSGVRVDLWDIHRATPIHSFDWGSDTVNTIRFNRVETELLLSTASDRSVILYDTRARSPLRKLILNMQTNAICWNPMISYHFTTASEDSNLYTFDTRRLDHAIAIHEDHINAVMSVDYSPTGQEFVSGSYDKTIRIFNAREGHSKEIYHTKRMQRVFCVRYTLDSSHILSGSDDCNVRVWRANANQRGGIKTAKQQQDENYREALKSKFQFVPQLRKIQRHKIVPKYIMNSRLRKDESKKAKQKREENRRKHTKEGTVEIASAKKKAVRKEVE